MKKVLVLTIAAIMLLSLGACGGSNDNSLDEREQTAAPVQSSSPEPTQAPTAVPETESVETPFVIPESIVYTGSGDSVISIEVPDDLYIFYIEGNAQGRHFAVKAYDSNGKSTALLVNTTDVYSGITLDSDFETATLEISAHGDWRIEVRSIYMARIISVGDTITGSGDEVLLVLSSGTTATISGNAGGRHFAVKSYGTSRNNLMVNTTDEYSGTVMIKGDPVVLEISAKDAWSITFDS